MNGATLFRWLQDADFYRDLHAEAVRAVPGRGSWLDVGTGAGLVAILAARQGHQVLALDRSEAMLEAARRAAERAGVALDLTSAPVADLATARSFDTVSAASVLINARAPTELLEELWRLVRPGGTLLVIETTVQLRPTNAARALRGRRAAGLLLWSLARRGRTVAPVLDAFRPDGLREARQLALLGGLVGAWFFTRSPTLEQS